MSAPVRIQRQRTRGWRMPEGAVYVGRPTPWGNPWRIGDTMPSAGRVAIVRSPAEAVEVFRGYASRFNAATLAELAGRDLACWCPLDQPCHADVLLELANQNTHLDTQENPCPSS